MIRSRIRYGVVVAAVAGAMVCSEAHAAADPAKVLRIASPDITSLDPQQGTDLYSTRIATHIFEALYEFDYFATPAKVIPNTAEALPDVTDGGKTWTMRIRKGIFFADDPLFKGKPRELVADDYVYSIKRHLDPNLRNGGNPALTELIAGARPVVDDARKSGAKMNYDAPIEGLRAIDRYTLQIRLNAADYTLLERMAGLPMMAVAREVVEAAGADVMSKPVGTGPYRLVEWRKASRLVLEANPKYRTIRYPESAEPQHRALVDAMRGKALPQIGRIEVSIIEESQPELLAFMQTDLDLMLLAGDDASRVMQDGKLKPELVKRGIQHIRFIAPSVTFTYFNMDDPVVGGYSNAQVALRRAIAMGFDIDNFIKVLFAGNALPANQLLPPGVNGHDPALPPKSLYDPAAARALLDRFGFKDVDGDGYRETPDGKPLTLVRGTLPESWYRDADTLWKKNMDAIGIRMQINQQTFAELLNQMRAGKLQMFNLGYRSLEPSGFQILQTLWSKEQRDTNPSQFKRPDYDAAYEAFLRTPAGPERTALARKMSEISQAWVPMILHTYGVGNAIYYPWVIGYWPSQFGGSWKYADLDVARRKAAGGNGR
ncbi:MAG TPA: ABC transporter substrate-binding protein [Casimicrobiaceae bacterium]|nr:ABC transporter substrate-binding protein [Casimicrobiaceae bacterium]